MGRPRHARLGSGGRIVAAPRCRLRLVPALHRRVPDRSTRRPGHARLEPLPLLLDAGTVGGSRAVPGAARLAGLRLRHLPGSLSVEPRDREAQRRPPARSRSRACGLARGVAGGRRRRSWSSGTTGSTFLATIHAGCAGTRSSPPATSAAPTERGAVARHARGRGRSPARARRVGARAHRRVGASREADPDPLVHPARARSARGREGDARPGRLPQLALRACCLARRGGAGARSRSSCWGSLTAGGAGTGTSPRWT